MCLQSGIANEPAALRRFPNVQGVSVACPTSHLEPGVVQAWSAPVTGLLDIGVYPTGIDQISEAVAAEFRAATFSSYPVDDIRRWKHRKLLTNLGDAIEAVCGPHARQGPLGDMLLAEGEAVLSAAGHEAATAEEDRTRRADLLQLGEIAGQTRPGGSSWQGLRRGTGDIETDYLNSTARSCSSAGYMAFRHPPTTCCSDWHESLPSPAMRPARLRQRRSWSDSKRPRKPARPASG